MFSGWFNRKKQDKENSNEAALPVTADFGFLGADMHSHFIPGIDDGSNSVELSISMLRSMIELGYTTLITTPHVMIDFYPNTTETITAGLQVLQNAIKENDLNIVVKAAAEYYIDEYFIQKIETEPLLTIYNKEVLIEFSMFSEPPMLKEVIFKMMTSGYRPILAHPERYSFISNSIDRFMEFKDRGCLLQLNILSLTGYYGANVKKVAEQLLEHKLYDYCGTDIHHEKHIAAIKALTNTKVYQALYNYPFLNKRLV